MLIALAPCAAATEVTGASQAGPVEPAWILQQLVRPVPARTPFVELRSSAMLKTPLRVQGEYRRPDQDTLVREVRSPYAETTTIRAGRATIARAGRAPRSFALSRAPELEGLQASFGALLGGDHPSLQQQYRLQASGTHQRWTLVMAPREAGLGARLRGITLHGQDDELLCIETRPAGDAPVQRTLLAGAALAAADVDTEQALAALCQDGPVR